MASSTLTINGVDYDQSGRRAANYLIDGWGWDLDSAGYFLEFHEHTSGPQPIIVGPVPVSLSVGGTTVFSGDLIGVQPGISAQGRTWRYQCAGLEYRAAWIPVTANDGSGIVRFNVDPQNQLYYVASMAGQSVGQILTYILSLHSTALSAAGIATDATTTSQLGAMTLVPTSEVQIAGEHLWTAIQGFLARWARNIRPMIRADGLIRLVDVTTGAAESLTIGTDPIDPPLFSRNWATSATRVMVRGQGNIGAAYVSVNNGTLTPAWNNTEQTNWTYADFTNPTGPSSDNGTVTSVTSATTVTIQSNDALRTWAANYWNGIQAWIYLTKSTGTGITWTECRPVTACGSMSAGGTCSITLAYDLENSGASAYDAYQLIGTNVPLASGGLYDVWRLYNVTDPGGYVAAHLVTSFPIAMPFYGIQGGSVALTTSPTCQIVGPNSSWPASFQVLPETGQIMFIRPVVELTNDIATLNAGGTSVVAPNDVYMMLAYSRGALETPYPPDVLGVPQYSGTAYSVSGLQRTQFCDQYDYRYSGNSPNAQALAQMLQVAVKNTLTEGSVVYKGLYQTMQDPTNGSGTPGYLLSIAGNGYTTGDESLNIPVRGYSVQYLTEGGGLNYLTTLRCSTRQDPRTGESYFERWSVPGGGRIQLAAVQDGGSFGFRGVNYVDNIFTAPVEEQPTGNLWDMTKAGLNWLHGTAAAFLGFGPDDAKNAPRRAAGAEKPEEGVIPAMLRRRAAEAKQREALAGIQRAPRPGELLYGGTGQGGAATSPEKPDDAARIQADQNRNFELAAQRRSERDAKARENRVFSARRKKQPGGRIVDAEGDDLMAGGME